MFTPADRARVRRRWSDVDLALWVGADTDLDAVAEDWNARM